MKVFIVRHGESETNQAGLWTGWLDVPLTEKGRADAALARTVLSHVSFDKVYASDLSRAKNTAEIAIPGCAYEVSPMLREVNVGNIAGKPLNILTDNQRSAIASEGYVQFDGESNEAFSGRVTAFLQGLEKENYQNVAVFCHAGWLRNALDFAVGIRLPRKNICCNNCAVAVLDYSNSAWRLHSWINVQ